MLIIDTVAFCLNVVLLFVPVLRCTSGDDYLFSDNSDTLKEKPLDFSADFRRQNKKDHQKTVVYHVGKKIYFSAVFPQN